MKAVENEIPLDRTIIELLIWFKRRNLSTDSLTVILNFTNEKEAAEFDFAVKQEARDWLLYQTNEKPLDLRKFEIRGVKLKVESRLHHHAG